MNHRPNASRRRSLSRRPALVRRWLPAAVLVSLSACGSRAGDARQGGSADDVLAFVRAGARGDEARQLELLAAREDRNENGARVMREMHRPLYLRHFEPRAARLSGVRNDTAWWMVQGMGPDLSRRGPTPWVTADGVTRPRWGEPTDAELAALPKTRSEEMVVLVRGPEGWKLPLSSAHAGPLLLGLDSLDARCPYGKDPRPCRALADRLVRRLDSLPPGPRGRWAYLAPRARYRVRASQATDSLRLEVANVQASPYTVQTGVEVAVVNRSAVPLSAVMFRLLDAEGSVLVEHGFVSDLPPRGRKEAYVSIEGRNFPRPVRVELDWAAPVDP